MDGWRNKGSYGVQPTVSKHFLLLKALCASLKLKNSWAVDNWGAAVPLGVWVLTHSYSVAAARIQQSDFKLNVDKHSCQIHSAGLRSNVLQHAAVPSNQDHCWGFHIQCSSQLHWKKSFEFGYANLPCNNAATSMMTVGINFHLCRIIRNVMDKLPWNLLSTFIHPIGWT